MEQNIKQRIPLVASEGKILTNGTDFSLELYLAEGMDPNDWYEIPEEEYEEILKQQEEELN